MTRIHKLELTWIGIEECPRLKPRILLEDQEFVLPCAHRVTENDSFHNRLIFGENPKHWPAAGVFTSLESGKILKILKNQLIAIYGYCSFRFYLNDELGAQTTCSTGA